MTFQFMIIHYEKQINTAQHNIYDDNSNMFPVLIFFQIYRKKDTGIYILDKFRPATRAFRSIFKNFFCRFRECQHGRFTYSAYTV